MPQRALQRATLLACAFVMLAGQAQAASSHHHRTRHHHGRGVHVGVHGRGRGGETAWRRSNPAADARAAGSGVPIIAEAEKFIGAHNPTHFIGPWCGAFAALVTRAAGYLVPPGHLLAWNWIHAGARLPGPRPGAYAVRRGHVALVKAVIGRRVVLINGNYRNRVAESIEPVGRFSYVAPKRI